MAEINPTLSVVTFNANGLNTSMRRQRLTSDFRKQKHDSNIPSLQETHFVFKDTNRLKLKVWGRGWNIPCK